MNRNYVNFFFALLFSVALLSASAIAGSKDVRFKSNPHCGDCKTKIETAFQEVEGVEASYVCLESKTVKLTYNTDKTDEAKLKNALASMGYAADAVGADFECCKEKAGGTSCSKEVKTSNVKEKAGCCSKSKEAGAKGECSGSKEVKKS